MITPDSWSDALFALFVAMPVIVIALFPLAAAVALRRSRNHRSPDTSVFISIIVPVRGVDEQAHINFTALVTQTAPASLEVLFCVEDEDDPAVRLIRRVIAAADARHARIVISGPRGQRLGKVHNLIAGVSRARGERLVFIDSDVSLSEPGYVAGFVKPLNDAHVGLVTCFPAYRGARNVPAALLAGAVNHDLLGYFSLQAVVDRLAVANGSCLAIRRAVLEELGGLEKIDRHLLMDTLLARAVVAHGYLVHLFPRPAPVVRHRATLREWWQQTYRWQVGMRRVLSLPTFLGFCWTRVWFVTACVYLPIDGFSGLAVAVLGGALLVRLTSALSLNALFLRDRSGIRYLWLLPFLESANAAACVAALVSDRVTWRGRRYRIGRGGVAIEVSRRDVGREVGTAAPPGRDGNSVPTTEADRDEADARRTRKELDPQALDAPGATLDSERLDRRGRGDRAIGLRPER